MPHVLCILNDMGTADGVLEAGNQLARRLEVDMRVLHPRPESDPDFMPTEEVMTEKRQTTFKWEEDAQTDGFARLFARHQKLPAMVTLDEVRGNVADIVTSAASEAIMVVVGAAIRDNRVVAAACIQSLLRAGRGAIVVPALPVITIGTHPVIVWDEATQVKAAIETAMPFLLSADRIDILIRLDGERQAPLAELVKRLRREDRDVLLVDVGVEGRRRGRALLDKAQALNCDLLVMGAQTENWLHDALVGNVSSDVLSDINLPVLMQA